MKSLLQRWSVALAFASTALLAPSSNAQTIGCEVGVANGFLIPASGTGGGGGTYPTGALPLTPGVNTLNVAALPPGATHVTEVKLFGLMHTWVNDVQLVLTDPSGGNHNLFVRGGTATSSQYSCDFNGDYVIVPPCTTATTPLPASCTGTAIFAPGTYDQYFGRGTFTWPSGTNGIFNTPLDAIPAQTGTWTLTAYDWVSADPGSLVSFDVCFGTPLPPTVPAVAPTLTSPANAANVFGPVVNLVAGAVDCATSYEFDVDGTIYPSASSTFAFNSTPGLHTWSARGVNISGAGPWAASRTFTDLGAPPTPCNGMDLTTVPFTGGNGLGTGSAVFFDVDVLNPFGLTVSQLDTNANATAGTAFTIEVWTKPGTYVGSEQTNVPWTLAATGAGVSTGNNTASLVDVADFNLAAGVTGFAVRILGAGHSYTNGTGSNQFFANSDLTITLGKSQSTLFSSAPINNRIWNGRLRYNCFDVLAINVDCDGTSGPGAGAPSASYGAAGLAGAWNSVSGSPAGVPLNDIAGAATSVTVSASAAALWQFDNPNTTGDDELLMDDAACPSGNQTWTLSGLPNATYQILVYGQDPDPSFGTITGITVAGGLAGRQTCSGSWGAGHVLNETYVVDIVRVTNGQLSFTIDNQQATFPVLNGFQLTRIGFGPEPQSYCTSNTSASGGCVALVGWSGVPSISASSGFTVSVSGADGQRNSGMYYGLAPASIPFGLDGAFLCNSAPRQRLFNPLTNTGGTLGACDGSMSIDLLAFLSANVGALGQPMAAGQTVYVQGFNRDPLSTGPRKLATTDGLKVTFLP